ERMPGTDSNSGRCSVLYHSLNSCTCWASISTYTMKIPRPFWAMCPSPLYSVAAIVLPRLVGPQSSRPEPRRDTRHPLGSHLSTRRHTKHHGEEMPMAFSQPATCVAGRGAGERGVLDGEALGGQIDIEHLGEACPGSRPWTLV